MPQEDAICRAKHSSHQEPLQPGLFAVVIIGAGALGAQISLEFTRDSHHPATHITLIDHDALKGHNVPSSNAWLELVTHFGQQVIGNYKSELLAGYCRHLAPHIQWSAVPHEIADVGWNVLHDADLIITCTDSVLSRMEVAYAARMLGKPMLDTGVFGEGLIGGRVAWYAPHQASACYACGLSPATRSAALEYMSSPSLSCSSLPLIEAMGQSSEGASSVSLVASLLAQQLSHVDKEDSYVVRASEADVETFTLPQSSECPWHHRPKLISLDDEQPIRTALSQHEVLLLPWAIALTAMCDACGVQQDTPVRVTKLRQDTRCSSCGVPALRPDRVVDRIAFEDEIAERTPLQIGLPSGNVFPARNRIQHPRTF